MPIRLNPDQTTPRPLRGGAAGTHSRPIRSTFSVPSPRTSLRALGNRLALAAALALAVAPGVHAQYEDGTPLGTVASSVGELEVHQLETLEYPWGMALLPGDEILITEKPGRLQIFESGELTEVEGVPEVVYLRPGDQGGLLDVELDPDFANNRLVYLSYAEAADKQPENVGETGDARFGDYINLSDDVVRGGAVARGRLKDNQLHDVEVIWRQTPKTVGRGHFGHRLNFGPDGKLYITSGDRMRFEPALSLQSNLGKVVRINPDGSIPEDNPFAGQDDALGDIWSYGHRNILAAMIHPGSGQYWAFEMGPLGGDEVNLVEKGKSYGWPKVSNGSHYNGATIISHPADDEFQDPIRSWTPAVSPSGAMFYDGQFIPAWRGNVLVGGLSSQALVRLVLDEDRVAVEERIDMQRRIRDLVQARDGSILMLEDAQDGALLRMIPARTDAGRPVVAPDPQTQ